jgi:hypothetical protein
MENNNFLAIKNHPDYEATIDEVIKKRVDNKLMDEAIRKTNGKERAEAVYVLLKLNNRHIS